MHRFLMAAIAAACLLGAGSAQAQFYYFDGPRFFWDDRVNDSRHISCNVLNNVPSFNRMDRNNNNFITRWEFDRLGLRMRDFRRLDLNGNGIITRGEMRVHQRRCY